MDVLGCVKVSFRYKYRKTFCSKFRQSAGIVLQLKNICSMPCRRLAFVVTVCLTHFSKTFILVSDCKNRKRGYSGAWVHVCLSRPERERVSEKGKERENGCVYVCLCKRGVSVCTHFECGECLWAWVGVSKREREEIGEGVMCSRMFLSDEWRCYPINRQTDLMTAATEKKKKLLDSKERKGKGQKMEKWWQMQSWKDYKWKR